MKITKKIAVVNDDPNFLSAMESLLEELSEFKAVIIHEGSTAYNIIKKEEPSLIILDIRMESPETGWHVLDLLTLDPKTSKIPVIICSASQKIAGEKEKWLKQHGIFFLPKPFDVNDLLGMIGIALSPVKKKKYFKQLLN